MPMPDTIDYGKKMHHAMRSLIKGVLQDVADHGLPGAHHFFITYDTQHPDVEMADWLFDRYPEEITIVIQNWYDALFVGEDGFQITLNFGDSPEPLKVPFDALRTFVDPSVEFGLRFESHDSDEEELPELHDVVDLAKDELPEFEAEFEAEFEPEFEPKAAPKPARKSARKSDAAKDTANDSATKADVVSLDSFRKS